MFTPVTSNPDPKSAGLDVLGQQVLGQHFGHGWVNVNNTKARAKKDGSYQPNLISTNKQQRGRHLGQMDWKTMNTKL